MTSEKDFKPIAGNLTIGGREIPLRYTMMELAEIEEQIGAIEDLKELFLKGRHRVRNMALAFCIMGNAGLKESGQTADLTADWILNNMQQNKLQNYQVVLLGVFTRGMFSAKDNQPDEKRRMTRNKNTL